MSRTTGQLGAHRSRRRRRTGFTLIELLTIIVIIIILVGIIMPTVNRAQNAAQTSASMARIWLIDGACKMYHGDFDEYPSSTPVNIGDVRYRGRHRLVQELTGYFPDVDYDAKPSGAVQNDMYDDGHDGLGFRMVHRGKVYGAAYGVEKLETFRERVTNSLGDYKQVIVFVDTFGNPIYYYRYISTGYGAYVNNDNVSSGWGVSPEPPSVNSSYSRDLNGKYFRKDFILMSRGVDRQWMAFRSDQTTDDITNFLKEQ